jgi:hypothetical protein
LQKKASNARHHPPRARHIKHSSLADEGRAIRGLVELVVNLRFSKELYRTPLHGFRFTLSEQDSTISPFGVRRLFPTAR